MNVIGLHWWSVNIGSGNGLVPSGNNCQQQAITWANVDPDLCRHMVSLGHNELTRWGWVTHICVSKLTIIGSGNGLLPGWHQAIIWTNGGYCSFEPLGINFWEISMEIHTFSLKKMHLKMSSAKWQQFCLGLNVLMHTKLDDAKVQISLFSLLPLSCQCWSKLTMGDVAHNCPNKKSTLVQVMNGLLI